MSWKRSEKGIEALCDKCGTGIIGSQSYVEKVGWTLLCDDAFCEECFESLEWLVCPTCEERMFMDVSWDASYGLKKVKCYVCENCEEKVERGEVYA